MSPFGVTPTLRNHPGEIEPARLEREISALKVQIKHQEIELGKGPALEQELAELTRGYEQSKENYGALLKNKIAAEMAAEQLRRHQGQLSRTIDLSRLPLKPRFSKSHQALRHRPRLRLANGDASCRFSRVF